MVRSVGMLQNSTLGTPASWQTREDMVEFKRGKKTRSTHRMSFANSSEEALEVLDIVERLTATKADPVRVPARADVRVSVCIAELSFHPVYSGPSIRFSRYLPGPCSSVQPPGKSSTDLMQS